MQRRILHLDMDAFYASVETLDQPELAGKPLLVGGLGPRSVVCACSYEARKFGVHSAMPMRHARCLCPKGIVLPTRMKRYAEISAAIFGYLETITPLVEKMSIDEGYLDISGEVSSGEEALALGASVKDDVRKQFGLSCSVGVAPCKFISKIASDLRKPNALVMVSEEEIEAFLSPLGVDKIPGVGAVGMKKLHGVGVHTIEQLRGMNHGSLNSMFGKWGGRLFDFARGVDPRPVITTHERKSLGTEQTFDQDLTDLEKIRETIQSQAEQLAKLLQREQQSAQTVTLKVRYSNFQRVTRQRTFPHAVRLSSEIGPVGCDLLRLTEAGSRPIRLIGMSVSSFAPVSAGYGELPLFSMDTDSGSDRKGDLEA